MKKYMSLLITLLLLVMMSIPVMGAEQPTINLGTTSSFAVLAGSTITNTGTTTISGDAGANIGLHPGTSFPGQADLVITDGAIHLTDDVAIAAKDDLVTAYDDAASRKPVIQISSELGGTTLKPGIYDSADGTFQITGTLTLDGNNELDPVFVFQSESTLITATSSNINLINDARYCRTFWQVGSSATLGTNSHFVGHILALTSITANNGATVQGQLLARNGAVTLDNNTITNGFCTININVPKKASLQVIKHVINDNGRTAVAEDFTLHVMSNGTDVEGSPASGAEFPGTTYTLDAGTYQVKEDVNTNYTLSYSGDCDSDGNITLAAGDSKTVIITNDDIPIEQVDNDNDEEQDNDDNTTPGLTATTPPEDDTTPTVTTPPEVVTETVTGGELPKTSTPWEIILLAGAALVIIGAVSLYIKIKL